MRGLTFYTAVSVFSIAAAISLSPRADAASLTGYLVAENGEPMGLVTWFIGITNPTSMDANNAEISSITLTQVGGAACTPVVTSLGGSIGNITAHTTAVASPSIEFAGCAFNPEGYPVTPPTGATFDLNATFVADGFTGSLVLDNLFELDDGTVYPVAAATPLPPSSMLFGSALLGLGLFGWRRKRKNTTALAV
jgi:LPXTG-motif cell wall-anchored protein